MRGGLGRDLVEDLAHFGALILGPLADGRAAANFGILFDDLGGASLRDQRAEVML